jgi:hypothetical protein
VVTYPTGVNRNPANTRVRAGLPAPGVLGSAEASSHVEATRDLDATRDLSAEPRPGETEIIEDIYEN